MKEGVVNMFILPVSLAYMELVLRAFGETSFFSKIFYPIAFAFACGLFICAVTLFFSSKVIRIVTKICLFGPAVQFSAECVIKHYFMKFMPFGNIFAGAKGVATNYLNDALTAIVKMLPAIILLFAPGAIYCIFGRKWFKIGKKSIQKVIKRAIFAVVLFALSCILARSGATKPLYTSSFDFDTATRTFGLLTSMRRDATFAIFGNKAKKSFVIDTETPPETETEQEMETEGGSGTKPVKDYNKLELKFPDTGNSTIQSLNEYVQSLTPSKTNEYTGLFEGKNLVMVCAEAFSMHAVNETMTPTLYRMIHNGFYFSDFYQPTWGGSTITGEYSFTTGLVPIYGIESFKYTKDNNMSMTMASQLSELGYTSYGIHNGDYNFYDRHINHLNLGYEFLSIGNGLEEYSPNGWGNDYRALSDSFDHLTESEPFYLYYMTCTGHCPYLWEKGYADGYYDDVVAAFGNKAETTTLYLCSQMVLEEAMTELVDRLEEAGKLDDTVIVLCADHFPYGLMSYYVYNNGVGYIDDLYGYAVQDTVDLDKNALIIWSPCLEKENKDLAIEVSSPVFSPDIVPTLSNLFGLDFDSRLYAGRDVFAPNTEPLVFWPDGSWRTDEACYVAEYDKFYPTAGGRFDPETNTSADMEEQRDAYCERISNLISNKYNYSTQVVDEDYFGYLFGN